MRIPSIKIINGTVIVSLLSSGLVFAQDVYLVKEGDVLSKVVQERFPDDRVYGKDGKLKKVLELNPDIQDKNLIFPAQKILLNSAGESISTPSDSQSVKESPTPGDSISQVGYESAQFQNPLRHGTWSLTVLYGGSYYSLTQGGAQGSAGIGESSFDNYQVKAVVGQKDFSAGLDFGKDAFKFSGNNTDKFLSLHKFGLWAAYGSWLVRLDQEQLPFFRNNNGVIEDTILTTTFASAGWRKIIDLTSSAPTHFVIEAALGMPVQSSSSSPARVSHASGSRVKVATQFDHAFLSKSDYTLYGVMRAEAAMYRLSQDSRWGVSEGSINSDTDTAGILLGLKIQF